MMSTIKNLVTSVAKAYADLLRRQRAASSAFVSWQRDTRRSHEFLWLGGVHDRETFMREGRELRIERTSPVFDAVQKMHATAELNPYEREVLYGHPYVIGRLGGRPIRAPLLTIPAKIEASGSGFVVSADDDVVRLNTLPFRSEEDTAARQLALAHLLAETPSFPLRSHGLADFEGQITRELPDVRIASHLDGRLVQPPEMPNRGSYLEIVSQAALFVAPKTSYFLVSDLEGIADQGADAVEDTALASLIFGAGAEPQAEFDSEMEDTADIYYPFPSNRSQRRVALLVDHPETRVIRVEGPPGTGKSQTIANLACHLAATNRTVLIISQKDQALRIVDEKLRELGLAQLPMTLLRRDAASRKELRDRLDRIDKTRPAAEATEAAETLSEQFSGMKEQYGELLEEYTSAVRAEDEFVVAEKDHSGTRGLRRLISSWRFRRTSRRLQRTAPRATDELAEEASEIRDAVLDQALGVLESSLEKSTATAPRNERQQIRVFSALLKRNQTAHKNFSIFDRLKDQPERAAMLLRLLPVWIMTPDDAARLFPCQPGLFDVVVVDEASQVDLPSIAPILFRAKKVVISGDTRQMQPRRFAFTHHQVAVESWHHHGLKDLDPEGWLDPVKQSLLTLAAVRAEEENLLDEHYRSLPPIISFSNERWYDGRLRIMTDETRKRFGDPTQPIIELHQVENGKVSMESQENEAEARAVVAKLKELLAHPAYADATLGIMCLFEEQVALVQDLIAEEIEPEIWQAHDLVVVNPDGFQGDERDVILYSLSFDNDIMPRQALSARQQESEHIQGMLNVAFTRARDEMHVFHSAPIDEFTFADGRPGALTDWLAHCATERGMPRVARSGQKTGQSDSDFEAEVAEALTHRGFAVTQQYPACGFRIDMVLERGGRRLAVECDGEAWHHDEHGQLRVEDLERQAVLERAGWKFLRIPYRRWRQDNTIQIERIEQWFDDTPEADGSEAETGLAQDEAAATHVSVTGEENALVQALQEGLKEEDKVYRRCRELLGYARLGNRIKSRLQSAASSLERKGYVSLEEGELYLTSAGRNADFHVQTSMRRSVGHRLKNVYPITCAQCGQKATVPFKPKGSSPLYCRNCYWRRRGSRR